MPGRPFAPASGVAGACGNGGTNSASGVAGAVRDGEESPGLGVAGI